MKNIAIYEDDAASLTRTASKLSMTVPDLVGMIISQYLADSREEDIPKAMDNRKQPVEIHDTIPSAAKGPLLTTKEVAEYFKTSASTINQWFHDGFIPAEVAEGSVFRFSLDKVCFALASRAKERSGRRGSDPFSGKVPTF